MNINTANLKVGLAASTDPTRHGISTIHFTPEYTEATDGHILARVSLPTQYPGEDLPSSVPTLPAEHLQPFCIPAKEAMKIKTMKHKNLPCLHDTLYIDVAATNANGTARLVATNLDTTISPELRKVDTTYPDTKGVMPTEAPTYRIGFNISLLQTLLTIAAGVGADTVTIEGFSDLKRKHDELLTVLEDLFRVCVTGADNTEAMKAAQHTIENSGWTGPNCNNKPWVLRTEHDNQKFTGLIMPIRL